MTKSAVELVDASNRDRIIFTWPWHSVIEFAGSPAADPTDMDVFRLTVENVGIFMFECDDCVVTQTLFERCKESSKMEGLERQLSSMRASHADLHSKHSDLHDQKQQTDQEIQQLREQVRLLLILHLPIIIDQSQ
jgi:hypothetical protein